LHRLIRPISTCAAICLTLSAGLACAPRSQREAIAMAETAYYEDRCKGVLVRLEQARIMSRKPLDRESRRMEVECSYELEDAEVAEQRLHAVCQDFDWSKDGVAVAVIKTAAVYPVDRAAREVDGYVRLGLEIDDEGRVAHARILTSEPGKFFDSAAKKAVMQWRYCPRRYLPVDARWPKTAEMRFKLPVLRR
jgi:TonB family protein